MVTVSKDRFLLTILLVLSLYTKVNGLEYGNPCQLENDECNSTKYLQCGHTSGVCECMNTLHTWYDKEDDVCKLLVGAGCSRNVGSQSCVKNGLCPETLNPNCTCDLGYDVNKERQCFLSYDKECNPQDTVPGAMDRCDPAGFLRCTPGNNGHFCKCMDVYNSVYNSNTKTCYLLSTANCSLPANSMPCIDNSVCDVNDRKCRCELGFVGTPERKCHIIYGGDCDPLKDTCNTGGRVTCDPTTQKCSCAKQGESIYYEQELGCRLLEGAGCTIAEGSQRCIDDAECRVAEESEPRRCKCLNNLSPNKNRECHLTFRDICDQPQDYCDPAGFLECSNNLCACKNGNSFYDPVAKECRHHLGTSCRPGLIEQPCGNNAACDLNTETCRCNALYEDAGDGNCLRSYGAPCSNVDPCNGRNQLACYDGRCSCISGFVNSNKGSTGYDITCLPGYMQKCPFDDQLQLPCAPEPMLNCIGGVCACVAPGHHIPAEGRCAILAGNDCIPLPDNTTNVCVTNAFCQTAGYLPGKCICEFGYRAALNGICISGGVFIKAKMLIVSLLLLVSLNN